MSNTTARAYRLDHREVEAATAALPDGQTMTAFIRACQRALAEQPAELLAVLTTHWPADRPIGRPAAPRSDQP